MQFELKRFILQLRHTFAISRESRTHQPSLIVCLHQDGHWGYGEATSNLYYNISIESLVSEIQSVTSFLTDYTLSSPPDFHKGLQDRNLSNFAICALDAAAWDLYGKIKRQPLYKLWNSTMKVYPITNYTIGLDEVSTMVSKIKEKPWPIYKIKLGTTDDVGIVKELRKHTTSVFRVDANCAWSWEKTKNNAKLLKMLGVEFIEQPLRADDFDGMKKLSEDCALPIIADESCILPEDVKKCAHFFDGINIKLMKCGGLTPALSMIAEAKKLNLKAMVGCMTESSVGISAIAQLLPQLDYVDMDGALLLSNDIAHGVKIEADGIIHMPQLNGSGIELIS